ncbi:hypothetical protein [Anatilimnocola floriformis]|uniref:hypothetical protein n=1 Tax=Anatilimnocola floriformis TaxID=2948575 RepID=UPI0020C4738D|nr:hypothetical protein [Anatilimnocola floriformis]
MSKPIQQDSYQVALGNVTYAIRLMIGRIGYWGEWYCPLCGKSHNAEPRNDTQGAREAVKRQVELHHFAVHLPR